MDWTQIVSIALNLVFGGGFIFSLITIRAQRKKANAEAAGAIASAESTELENVEKAIRIWREMAEQLQEELKKQRAEYVIVTTHIDQLKKEVKRLTETSNRILRLLDSITPENLDKMKEQIKNEIGG